MQASALLIIIETTSRGDEGFPRMSWTQGVYMMPTPGQTIGCPFWSEDKALQYTALIGKGLLRPGFRYQVCSSLATLVAVLLNPKGPLRSLWPESRRTRGPWGSQIGHECIVASRNGGRLLHTAKPDVRVAVNDSATLNVMESIRHGVLLK